MSSVLEVSLEETVPLSPEVLACPHEYNTRLRAEAPVYKCPHSGIFFISDYETSRAVLRDHETFSNRFSVAMRPQEVDPRVSAIQQQGWPGVDTMLTQDPPAHRRYRGLVNQAFTARRVKTLAPRIEEICNELIDAFADAGFPATAFLPSYGLAEATLAVSIMPPGEGIRVELVEETQLSGGAQGTDRPQRFRAIVNCGKPVRDMVVEIREEDGTPLPDGAIGKVWCKGPSVMVGYFRDDAATEACMADGWLDTGDMGYMSKGYIYIVGRAKDMIMLGKRIPAPEAKDWGLVTEVVADGLALTAMVDDYAGKLNALAPLSLRTLKRVLNATYDTSLKVAMELEGQSYEKLRGTEDYREGIESFTAKRKAEYKGR